MYGINQYGTTQYASESQEASKEECYLDLTRLVPEFVWRKLEMHELYKAQGYEVGYLQHCLEDMIAQCFLSVATWGISRWEQVFAVETNLSLTYEQRREILIAKIRGQGTTTKEMIEETAGAFSGGEAEVIEDSPNSIFLIRFVGIKGIPRNMQGFISMIEEIKPAHLAYEIEYRYTLWAELQPFAWCNLRGNTWEEVRIMEVE